MCTQKLTDASLIYRHKLLTDVRDTLIMVATAVASSHHRVRDTLLAFNGSAFAVRFSRSAIFLINELFGDVLASYRNSSIS